MFLFGAMESEREKVGDVNAAQKRETMFNLRVFLAV